MKQWIDNIVSNSIVKPGKTNTWSNWYFLDPNEWSKWSKRSVFAQTLCPFIWLRNKISDFKDEISLQHAWFLTRVGSQSYNVLTRISIFNWGWFAFSRTRRVHWLKAKQSALLPVRPKSWEVNNVDKWSTQHKVTGQNIRSKLLLDFRF